MENDFEEFAVTASTFHFSVRGFSALQDNVPIRSPACYIRNLPWRLVLMPETVSLKGVSDELAKRYLRVDLECNWESKNPNWSICGECELYLVSVRDGIKLHVRKLTNDFSYENPAWCWNEFAPWNDMLSQGKWLIKNDTVTLEASIRTFRPRFHQRDTSANMGKIKSNIGFIGGGNMAKAICQGTVKTCIADYSQIYVSGPRLENLTFWEKAGANVSTSNGFVVEHCDIIFIAVKPHILPAAIANIHDTLTNPVKDKLFVSVLAGIKLEQLENTLSAFQNSRVVRVMPNTPMLVGEGCTVFCPGQKASLADVCLIRSILEVSGLCRQVPESLIDAVGALSGSGPAFVYLMIEALADGGVKMGIPREMATEFAAKTVLGAAKMVLETGKHTGQLRDEVCSPGGTTITGIHALERGGVRSALMDAIEAAAKKSEELGQRQHTT